MAYNPSTYVVVYNKKTGEGTKIYRATLSEFLATGDYTTQAPDNARPSPARAKEGLPSAGREATRDIPAEAFPGVELPEPAEEEAEEDVKPEVKKAPAKPAPKRRAAAEEKSE